MHARPADEKQLSPFDHASSHGQQPAEYGAERVRVGTGHHCVARRLRTGLVGAIVRDQFARAISELANFQTASRHGEERIYLRDEFGRTRRERDDETTNRVETLDARLDLDVPRHGLTAMAIAPQHAEIRAPGTHRLPVLMRHDA